MSPRKTLDGINNSYEATPFAVYPYTIYVDISFSKFKEQFSFFLRLESMWVVGIFNTIDLSENR